MTNTIGDRLTAMAAIEKQQAKHASDRWVREDHLDRESILRQAAERIEELERGFKPFADYARLFGAAGLPELTFANRVHITGTDFAEAARLLPQADAPAPPPLSDGGGEP